MDRRVFRSTHGRPKQRTNASTSKTSTLEPECCKRLSATSNTKSPPACSKSGHRIEGIKQVHSSELQAEGQADGARECMCPIVEHTMPDIGSHRYLCRRGVRNDLVHQCTHCGRVMYDECARIDYEAGGVMCLQPCIDRETPSIPGSSNSEPAIHGRAISQSICCASHDGSRARRSGGERVRREIT